MVTGGFSKTGRPGPAGRRVSDLHCLHSFRLCQLAGKRSHPIFGDLSALCEICSRTDVVIEFLLSLFCQKRHSMTYLSKTQGTALHSDPGRFQRSLVMSFTRIRHLRDGRLHSFDKCCTRLVELPDYASCLMLALPSDVIRGRFVSERD